jgi:rRNA maturation protein Nop10
MATDYISQDVAVTIADYAADKHPYDKDTKKPETYSEYNRGWNDACDYIRERLEGEKPADVEPVRRGRWKIRRKSDWPEWTIRIVCSSCGLITGQKSKYCPNCGSKMQEAENE